MGGSRSGASSSAAQGVYPMSNVGKFTMGSGGLPAGSYLVEFSRCEPYTENVDKYGEAVRLVWIVADGDHKGEEGYAVCSAKLTPKSKLTKFATALKAGPISAGEEFDFANHVGAKGIIVVEETENGASKVVSCVRT
jgi:hypothetical protein